MKNHINQTPFKFALVFLLNVLGLCAHAQINVSVNVLPPYDPNLFEYTEADDRVLITLTNISGQTHRVKLQGSFKNIDESVVVATNENYQPAFPIELGPGESRMLTAAEFEQIFPSEAAINVTGISRAELLRTRRLPAGIYRLCVRAYDFDDVGQRTPLSNQEPSGCSVTFVIATINPPEITQFGGQLCGAKLTPTEMPNFLLQWIAPPQAPIDATYQIEMVEVLNSDYSAYDAFESATTPMFFSESVQSVTSFLYHSGHPPMVEGYSYAIRIRITDPSGLARFANGGLSEPCMFRYGERSATGGGSVSLEPAYPTPGAYVPFDNFPVIVHFSPYDDNYYRMIIGNSMTINGLGVGTGIDEIRWPWGPAESQTREVGIDISDEEAAYIAINRSNPTPEGNVTKGATYEQEITANFLSRTTSSPISTRCSFEYTSGIGVPICQSPANGSTVSPGSIDFQFLTAEKPTVPLPPFDIMRRRAGGEEYEGIGEHGVTDAYKLVISTNEDLDSAIVDTMIRFTPDVTIIECLSNPALLDEHIYITKNHSFPITAAGTYYWRVSWLGVNASGGINTSPYVSSETQRFVIGDEEDDPTHSATTTREDCIAECRAPAITDNTAVGTIEVGDVVKVGLFDATITEIRFTGTSATGKATMAVPLMRAPLKVKFSGVGFNAAKKLIIGEMLAVSDLTDVLPSGLAETFGRGLSLSEAQSQGIEAAINTGGRLISQFTGSEPMGLPIGLDNQIDGNQYTIGIVGCKFNKEIARLNAVISLGIPQLHGFLSLQASEIPFHPNGIDASEAMLSIPIDKTLEVSDDISFTLKAPDLPRDSGTYVMWDCDGFKELAISGTVDFSREIAVPDTEDGTPGTGTVQGRFKTKISNLNGWICNIDMDNFQPTSAPGWGVHVNSAVLDFSDASNDSSMSFPSAYVGDTTALWHGFYLKRAALVFPQEFETFGNADTRLTAAIEGLLIDRTGLSMSIELQNIISISQGNMDGWGYSLDRVYLSLANSEFREAGFGGAIKLPIAENDTLIYNASLNRSSAGDFAFEFRIQPADTISIDIWEGKLNLFPTSRVNVVVDRDGFGAGADLSGYMSFFGDMGSSEDGGALSGVGMRGIEFQNLTVNSRGPNHLDCRHFAFASEQHESGGFPLSIRDIGLVNRSGPGFMEFDQSPGARVGIRFSVDLNLTGESDAFRASTRLAFMGKLNLGGDEAQVWTFSGVDLDSIAISGKVGAVELEGSLVFYNTDPTYGKGIKGSIRAKFEPAIEVQASVQFGSVNDYRYWYVDAQATWTPGVSLFAGVDLRGIGGGAWYHMRKPDPVAFSDIVGSSFPSSEAPGATMTGKVFRPDRNVGLGFEARLLVGATGGSSAYHGMIALGAQFTESTGGIERLYLEGDFIIMSQTNDRSDAVASADFLVNYNFPEKKFMANFNVYVNVYNVLVGVNENNLAGAMEILAMPGDWHIFVGQPETPVGLKVQIGETEIARAQFYFMVGLSLPPMPGLPEEITSRLNVSPTRSHLVLAGDGFAMGTFLSFDMDFRLMPFYVDMAFGIGFDLSVLKVSEGCNGRAAEDVGADGWYAQGQIYAYLDFSTGLYVDLWFVSGEFEILGLQVAAYLQGGFPNPSWAKGEIGGRYRILGGLIKGNFHYAFEAGTPCIPVVAPPENPLAGLDMITAMHPINNARNVEVEVEPAATYNFGVDNEFSITMRDHLNVAFVRHFRIDEKQLSLKKGGVSLAGNVRKEQENMVSVFTPTDMLEGHTSYVWTSEIVAMEKVDERWVISRKNSGEPIDTTAVSNFSTGPAPETISDRHVGYSYPFKDQRYFLQDECRSGVVALKQRMAYLFNQENTNPDYFWRYYVRFIPMNGQTPIEGEITGTATNYIRFEIPNLQSEMVYRIDIVAERKLTDIARTRRAILDQARTTTATTTLREEFNVTNIGSSTVNVRRTAYIPPANVNGPNFIVLYSYFFKTSKHNTLQAKLAARTSLNAEKAALGPLEIVSIDLIDVEPLDQYDVENRTTRIGGSEITIRRLVNFSSKWDPVLNLWMAVNELNIYDYRRFLLAQFPREATDWRPSLYGSPPVNTIDVTAGYRPRSLLYTAEKAAMTITTETAERRTSMSPSVSGGIGFSSSFTSSRSTSVSTAVKTPSVYSLPLAYRTPLEVYFDGQEVKRLSLSILTSHGGLGSEFLTREQKRRFSACLNSQYNYYPLVDRVYHTLSAYYNPPECQLGPDTQPVKYNFNFRL